MSFFNLHLLKLEWFYGVFVIGIWGFNFVKAKFWIYLFRQQALQFLSLLMVLLKHNFVKTLRFNFGCLPILIWDNRRCLIVWKQTWLWDINSVFFDSCFTFQSKRNAGYRAILVSALLSIHWLKLIKVWLSVSSFMYLFWIKAIKSWNWVVNWIIRVHFTFFDSKYCFPIRSWIKRWYESKITWSTPVFCKWHHGSKRWAMLTLIWNHFVYLTYIWHTNLVLFR